MFLGKKAFLNLGPNCLIWLFLAGTRKTYCTVVFFYISTFKFFQTKFRPKLKLLKFGTKNALFGYFWATILKELLSYLKSATLEFV